MGIFLSVLRPNIQCMHKVFISFTMIKTLNYVQFYAKHNNLVSSLRDTLGRILLMGAQKHGDNAQVLTDSYKLRQLDAEMQGALVQCLRDHST